jgi:hypothetical protein
LLGPRHRRAIDQNGDYSDIAVQGGLDLEADDVVRILQPPSACCIGGIEPVGADDRQQHRTGAHLLCDDFGEVDPQLDPVDIHEHPVLAEAGRQPVEEPASQATGLLPPVADEHAT